MNTKLHALIDTSGRPVRLFITAGQVSEHTGAAALMNGLPKDEWLLANREYDADWFRETLIDKGTKPCITGRKSRKKNRQVRQTPLQETQPYRENVRQAQGLEARRNSLR